jgi:hypothetical protein
MDLEKELIVLLVDKLLIGIIIILIGFWLNRRMEFFKSSQATRSEISKLRINKLSELWDDISNVETAIVDVCKRLSDASFDYLRSLPRGEKVLGKYGEAFVEVYPGFENEVSEIIDRLNQFPNSTR